MNCWHRKTTTPRQDKDGCYERCLDCGARIPWGWKDDKLLTPPRMTAPRATVIGDAGPEFKQWWRKQVEGGAK